MATSLNNLASLYQTKGDYAKAEPFYQRALAIKEKALGPEHPDVATLLSNLAALYQAMGEPAKAMQNMGRAVAIEDRNAAVLLNTGSDEQKRAYMATLRATTYAAISLHVQFAPNAEKARRLALTVILNRKGRVLDAMTNSFTALRRLLTAADRERLDRLKTVSAQYSALVWRGPGDDRLHDYQFTLARLDEERQNIEADISRRTVAVQGVLEPVTIEQVQAVIPAGAALVEMFRYNPRNPKANRWDKPRYVAYVLHRQGEITWVDLGEAGPIDSAAAGLLAALRRSTTAPRPPARDLMPPSESVADPQAPARDLDNLVMQPIRRLLGSTRRILLSPDGLLNLVPFAALVDEEGHYLIESASLTYLAGGRDLLRLQASAAPRQDPVVVAAPDYSAEPAPNPEGCGATRSQPSADTRGLWFSPLRFAAEEGRAIAQKLPGARLLTGTEATESAIKALAGPRVLHIATHGFFLPDQPAVHAAPPGDLGAGFRAWDGLARPRPAVENPLLRSGIALAGANRRRSEQDDGLLTALELSQVDLTGTKLVVLSACETGVGEIRSGDGVYGLRRALVMAGAETQVISLWSVDDAATGELMEAYYNKLLAGGRRGEAMRQAQIEMLGRPGRAHPYYWASFIVSGSDAPLGVAS